MTRLGRNKARKDPTFDRVRSVHRLVSPDKEINTQRYGQGQKPGYGTGPSISPEIHSK